MEKLIAIYRTVYLLPSEAFIPSQLSGFRRYKPIIWCRDIVQISNDLTQQLFEISCLTESHNFWSRLLFTLFGVTKVQRLPLLVHAHFGPDAAMILPFAKRNNLPLVVTYHGFDAQQHRRNQFKSKKMSMLLFLLREKALYRYATKIIVVSEFLKQSLLLRGCPLDKICVHYIGVDTTKFNRINESKIPNRLINVSRHVGWKGIDTILRAMPSLIAKHPDLQLFQVGEGSQTLQLKQLTEELGIADNVQWLGALPHHEVLAELQKASLYIHASRYDLNGQTEAFGIALIEAQACGLPVVATRSGGIPEAMLENETGLLFEENDHETLSSQVHKFLSDTDKLFSASLRARQFVIENFDVRDCTEKLENIYDEILAVKK
jgi:colanic acid/amylovoran biosynthesis glycosyltransferase